MNSHSAARIIQLSNLPLLFVFQSRNKTPSPIDTLRRLILNVQLNAEAAGEIQMTKEYNGNHLLHIESQ